MRFFQLLLAAAMTDSWKGPLRIRIRFDFMDVLIKNILLVLGVLVVAGTISWGVARWLIHNGTKIGLIDIPNERSSHTTPVPRGGGIGIVIAIVVSLVTLYYFGLLKLEILKLFGIVGAVALIGGIGFVDDRFSLSAFPRFICQTTIALFVIWLVGIPSFFVFPFLKITFLTALLSLLWIVSHMNFFNFMDGIDGLAGMQGLITGVFTGIYGWMLGDADVVLFGVVLVAATSGFLVFNLPPAQIFMGDVGSGVLGFYIALICVIKPVIWVPVILVMAAFIFDTIVTLLWRVYNGEKWYQAHRTHYYQRAVKAGFSHKQVTTFMSIVAVFFGFLGMLYLKTGTLTQLIILCAAGVMLVLLGRYVITCERNVIKVKNS